VAILARARRPSKSESGYPRSPRPPDPFQTYRRGSASSPSTRTSRAQTSRTTIERFSKELSIRPRRSMSFVGGHRRAQTRSISAPLRTKARRRAATSQAIQKPLHR